MNKIKLFLLSLVATIGMFATVLVPQIAMAAPSPSANAVCDGANFTSGATGTTGCDTTTAEGTVKNVVNLAIRLLQLIVGIISVFTIIIAGLGYITSAGDGAKTKTAKDRILYSAIGLMVVVLAEVIVRFVLNRVNSVTP